MESAAAYSLISSSLIKTSSPYVLVNNKDSTFHRSIKQVSGVVASSALILVGIVETIVYGILAFLTKTGHFLLLKNSDFSLKLDHSILQPLVTRSLMAAGNVAIAASRMVTYFQGAESVANADQAIREKCKSFARADFIQKIRHLHIDGFDSKSPTLPTKKGELTPSTPITTPSSAPTKWHLERKYILMGIGLLAASLLAYKVYEHYSLAAILPEPIATPTPSPTNTPVIEVPSQVHPSFPSYEDSQPSIPTPQTLEIPHPISLDEEAQQNLNSVSTANICSANETHEQKIHPATEESSPSHLAALIGVSVTFGVGLLLIRKIAICFNKKSSTPLDPALSQTPQKPSDQRILQEKKETPPDTSTSDVPNSAPQTSPLAAYNPSSTPQTEKSNRVRNRESKSAKSAKAGTSRSPITTLQPTPPPQINSTEAATSPKTAARSKTPKTGVRSSDKDSLAGSPLQVPPLSFGSESQSGRSSPQQKKTDESIATRSSNSTPKNTPPGIHSVQQSAPSSPQSERPDESIATRSSNSTPKSLGKNTPPGIHSAQQSAPSSPQSERPDEPTASHTAQSTAAIPAPSAEKDGSLTAAGKNVNTDTPVRKRLFNRSSLAWMFSPSRFLGRIEEENV